jgi:hypothetical protein
MRRVSPRSGVLAALPLAFAGLWTAAAQTAESSDWLKLDFEIRGRVDGYRNAKATENTD